MKDFGVVYFVNKNPHFRHMMSISMASLQRVHPDWPIEVIESPEFAVPLWKKCYRYASFWKWRERYNRGHQDWRVNYAKAEMIQNSPFEHTLLLDVDTVVLKPLDELYARSRDYDVTATPLSWSSYNGFEDWQPKNFPMIMSGVLFFNRTFASVFGEYAKRVGHGAGRYFKGEQYIVSLTWALEQNQRLKVHGEPFLQLDAMNVARHLQTDEYPTTTSNVLDLRYEEIDRFHIFHYNGPHKLEYLGQIKELWNLPES